MDTWGISTSGYYEQCCYEHWHTSICLRPCFQLFWVSQNLLNHLYNTPLPEIILLIPLFDNLISMSPRVSLDSGTLSVWFLVVITVTR